MRLATCLAVKVVYDLDEWEFAREEIHRVDFRRVVTRVRLKREYHLNAHKSGNHAV
jgi:hypothetical protein